MIKLRLIINGTDEKSKKIATIVQKSLEGDKSETFALMSFFIDHYGNLSCQID